MLDVSKIKNSQHTFQTMKFKFGLQSPSVSWSLHSSVAVSSQYPPNRRHLAKAPWLSTKD